MEMALPVSKAAWRLEDPATTAADIRRAFAIAVAGRPGPVHLTLPADLLELESASPSRHFSPHLRRSQP